MNVRFTLLVVLLSAVGIPVPPVEAVAQIGRRFPAEKKVVPDPVTGVPLTFLTSTPGGDQKIYPTHPQWTVDGKWIIFRSDRAPGQAMAVCEETGDLVQVTETGYDGTLCVGTRSMRLFFARRVPGEAADPGGSAGTSRARSQAVAARQIVAVDLARVFADSAADRMQPATEYEQVFGTVDAEMWSGHELAIDATEQYAYFRISGKTAARLLPPGTRIEGNFGPRNLGAGPSGIGKMELATGTVTPVVAVPFQVGHVQTNQWVPQELVFCWETGGKAPQRTWTVRGDGSGLRPLYPEAPYEWVTHEAVISRDEVAFAIMGNRSPGIDDEWGPSGTRVHPSGLGIVNLRSREMMIAGQTHSGSGFWHVHGSPDNRWAVGDDFARNVWLIDRRSHEMMLLTTGHKTTAKDHVHPSFHPDGTRIQIQSAMLSGDNRSLNICIVPVPSAWLKRP